MKLSFIHMLARAFPQASEKMSHVMQNVHSAPTADNPHEYRVVAPQGAMVGRIPDEGC